MLLVGSLTLGILVGKTFLAGKVLSVVPMGLMVVGLVLLVVGGRSIWFLLCFVPANV